MEKYTKFQLQLSHFYCKIHNNSVNASTIPNYYSSQIVYGSQFSFILSSFMSSKELNNNFMSSNLVQGNLY